MSDRAPDAGGTSVKGAIVNPLRNPVLVRELRERMRQRRAPVVLTVYLLVLAAIMSAVYRGVAGSREAGACLPPACFGPVGGPDALASAAAGRPVFQWILFFVLMLVCFIVPGVTSGAVASERERQTLVPLQVTLLSPIGILGGKLLASIAFTLLLLVATLPLMTTAYAIGGVSLGEILRGMGMVAAIATAIGCLSIACSAGLRRVQSATVASYGLVLALVAGTFILFGMDAAVSRGNRVNIALLVGNPFVATAHALGGNLQAGDSLASPFLPLQQVLSEHSVRGFWATVPFWAATLLLYAGLSVLSLAFAARRIRAPAGQRMRAAPAVQRTALEVGDAPGGGG